MPVHPICRLIRYVPLRPSIRLTVVVQPDEIPANKTQKSVVRWCCLTEAECLVHMHTLTEYYNLKLVNSHFTTHKKSVNQLVNLTCCNKVGRSFSDSTFNFSSQILCFLHLMRLFMFLILVHQFCGEELHMIRQHHD